jgi:hypothetical protein
MRGIDAAAIVTAVQDEQTLWNRAVREFPCETVSTDVSLSLGAPTQMPIAVTRSRPQPEPTCTGVLIFQHIAREAFREWCTFVISQSDPFYRVVRAVTVLITPWRPVYSTAAVRP